MATKTAAKTRKKRRRPDWSIEIYPPIDGKGVAWRYTSIKGMQVKGDTTSCIATAIDQIKEWEGPLSLPMLPPDEETPAV